MDGKSLEVEFYSKIVQQYPKLTCICPQDLPSHGNIILYTIM